MRAGMLLALLASRCFGQDVAQDAAAWLARMQKAQKANAERASLYTYTELTSHFEFDKNGEKKFKASETNEVMTLEGEPYHKLVARNEQPLSVKEAAKEDKKLAETAAERKKKHNGIFTKTYHYGWGEDELKRLFDCTLAEAVEIRGHMTQAVECVPKVNYTPANKHERETMNFKQKFWIDRVDRFPVRTSLVVVGNDIAMKPGTVIIEETDKINGDAWLAVSNDSTFKMRIDKMVTLSGYDEVRCSNFKKFDAKSSIVETSPPK